MSPQPKLPVITFNTETLNRSTDAWFLTSHAVRKALEDYGCVVISTDKIPSDLNKIVLDFSKDLFHLPMETKIKSTSQTLGFGYVKHSFLPLYECFGIENGDTMEATRSFSDILFPSGNNIAFCESTFAYMKLLSEIHGYVMRMVFDSYGVEDNQLNGSSFYLARFMKYRAPSEGESGIALPPHSDKSFLGVLNDNEFEGLEVKMRNGEWIYHQPSPSTLVVVAGEPLMAWSNGRIYAPLHQVSMRTLAEGAARYSTGLFSFMRETVEVPQKLVDDEHYLRFRPFNNMDFLKYVTTEEGMASKCAIESYCGITTDAAAYY